MSSPMTKIGPGIYWAGKRFQKRGLWIWTGKNNIRILPWYFKDKN